MSEDETLIAIARHLERSIEFRARLLALLARRGLYRLSRSERLYYRARAAAMLLSAGMIKTEAQAALRERFDVSRATAYRTLGTAQAPAQRGLFEC